MKNNNKLAKTIKVTTALLLAVSPFAPTATALANNANPATYETSDIYQADYETVNVYDIGDRDDGVEYEEVEVLEELEFIPQNNGNVSGNLVQVTGSSNIRVSQNWNTAAQQTQGTASHFPEHGMYLTSANPTRTYNNFIVTRGNRNITVTANADGIGRSIWLYFLPGTNASSRSNWQRILVQADGTGSVTIEVPTGFPDNFRVTQGKTGAYYTTRRPNPETVLPPVVQPCPEGEERDKNNNCRPIPCPPGQERNPDNQNKCEWPEIDLDKTPMPALPSCPEGEFMNEEGDCESDETFYDVDVDTKTPEFDTCPEGELMNEEGDCESDETFYGVDVDTETPEIDVYIPIVAMPGIVIAPDEEEGFYNVNVDGENDRGVNEEGAIDIYIPNEERITCDDIIDFTNLPDDWNFEFFHPPYGEGDYIRITVTAPPGYEIREEDDSRRKYLVPIPFPEAPEGENDSIIVPEFPNFPIMTLPGLPNATVPRFPSDTQPPTGTNENYPTNKDTTAPRDIEEIRIPQQRPNLPQTGTQIFATNMVGIAIAGFGATAALGLKRKK